MWMLSDPKILLLEKLYLGILIQVYRDKYTRMLIVALLVKANRAT